MFRTPSPSVQGVVQEPKGTQLQRSTQPLQRVVLIDYESAKIQSVHVLTRRMQLGGAKEKLDHPHGPFLFSQTIYSLGQVRDDLNLEEVG